MVEKGTEVSTWVAEKVLLFYAVVGLAIEETTVVPTVIKSSEDDDAVDDEVRVLLKANLNADDTARTKEAPANEPSFVNVNIRAVDAIVNKNFDEDYG